MTKRLRPPSPPLTTLMLLALTIPGCETELPPDGLDAELEDDAWDTDGMRELDLELRAPSSDDEPVALLPYPVLELYPPIRMEDLKPNQYMFISQDAVWDDINIERWNDDWLDYQPGYQLGDGEQHEVDWDVPVYAGIDGEVISCWRGLEYDVNYDSAHSQIGGNFLIIAYDDDHFVYYAHMNTNSIPSELCPNDPLGTHPDGPGGINTMGWMQDPDDFQLYSNIPEESFIPAGSRPQVSAGQYIGRIGSHGNSANAHLHMGSNQLYYVMDVVNIDKDPDHRNHMAFHNAYIRDGAAAPGTAWSYATDDDIPASTELARTQVWPGWKREATYAATYSLHDYDDNGADDLLCHDTNGGKLYIDDAVLGDYGATNWTSTHNWCNSVDQRLHVGDFDGDGHPDLLCHDIEVGTLWFDYYDPTTRYQGTDGPTEGPWCYANDQQLLVGDFDGDNKDDLLCHNHANGELRLDRADDGFDGTDEVETGWCSGPHSRLHVGRFHSSISKDLLCHDTLTGMIAIDRTPYYVNVLGGTDVFDGVDEWVSPWCYARGQRLFVGSVSGALLDDLICHDSDTGKVWVDEPYAAGGDWYGVTDWWGEETGWCTAPYQRLKIGDVDNDGRDDLFCWDMATGQRWIDYALDPDPGEYFEGTNEPASGWCYASAQALH